MHWGWKLLIALGAVVLLVAALIVHDLLTASPVSVGVLLPGAMGQENRVQIEVPPDAGPCTLVLWPAMESGWGGPDIHMEGNLLDASGRPVAGFDEDVIFGGPRPSADYVHTWADYRTEFPLRDGTGPYLLHLRVLTEHVKEVAVKIECEEGGGE